MKKVLQDEYIRAYDDFSDAIFRHCYFRVSSKEKAEDLVQDVFIKTWEYIEKGNKVKNVRALLYKIANNLIVDDYRKKKAVSLDQLREDGFDPVSTGKDEIENEIAGKEMLIVLEEIDSKYREVIIMRYIDDLSPKEIAEIVGESENNVSVRINRGLSKVRGILANEKQV